MKSDVTWEWRTIRGEDAYCDKVVNQWKHKFTVKIQSTHPCPHKEGHSVIYLIRIPK
jgi:hypothetical protein